MIKEYFSRIWSSILYFVRILLERYFFKDQYINDFNNDLSTMTDDLLRGHPNFEIDFFIINNFYNYFN